MGAWAESPQPAKNLFIPVPSWKHSPHQSFIPPPKVNSPHQKSIPRMCDFHMPKHLIAMVCNLELHTIILWSVISRKLVISKKITGSEINLA